MKIKTFFRHGSTFERGEVEVRLLPGIPQLHVIGLPDAALREAGIKLKAALKACGLDWPRGHQVVVNLRPASWRKSSAGADLAIALGLLAQTRQLSPALRKVLSKEPIVYGEVTLAGRVEAPGDIGSVLRAAKSELLISGPIGAGVGPAHWCEITSLSEKEPRQQQRQFDWSSLWRRPQLPEYDIGRDAARALALAVHAQAHVLVAGPQGSGKSTWARALHALTARPEPEEMAQLADLFGDEVLRSPCWRPCEQPHHSATAQAMIGGGTPLRPGVISRAHGGVLILDEFLEFPARVIEALREPLESGHIEIARRSEVRRLPARFQLVATTNLCVCGQLSPERQPGCGRSLMRCRAVCDRLSGPLLDRFDLLVFSHGWLRARQERVPLSEVRAQIERAESFRRQRRGAEEALPEWVRDLGLSHRRGRALRKLARALADLECAQRVSLAHWQEAADWVIQPMGLLGRLFG